MLFYIRKDDIYMIVYHIDLNTITTDVVRHQLLKTIWYSPGPYTIVEKAEG